MLASPNFAFLKAHDPQLVRLGTLAEQYFATDPNTCLIKLRQFGELLAQLAAANISLYITPDERQVDLLGRLRDRGLVNAEVSRLFHELRLAGNSATHTLAGDHRTALSNLKYARLLGIWFHRSFSGEHTFKPGPFIPPADPATETQALKQELERLLFLVDRTALEEQTANAFKDSRMESLQSFADIFEIKELGDTLPESDTKVHIATVQSFVKRILYPTDTTVVPTADQYDCVVVDECHRGYLLDRELSEAELTFRDFRDYVSKYRRVLDYFDAVKIGLTATPALHTTEIFGEPVYQYTYREAVIDGWLIDHESPIRIVTALSEEGMVWNPGEAMEFLDPQTGQLDLSHAPDEVKIEVEKFNKRVITEEFNRVVCQALAQHIDPDLPEKTLIFCATDNHADIVVDQLKQALAEQYGSVEDDAVVKITAIADKPLQSIRAFRNEAFPKIAVTVDLLTTGIDVPAICNLVFIRRVNSRILYEQMLGRATRRCDQIGKDVFRIFDAVNLYEAIAPVSDMKPVVVNPQISFSQLVDELAQVHDPTAMSEIVDQLLAKLQRKRHLSDASQAAITAIAGMPMENLAEQIRRDSPT